jgi:hypothetical protein
MQKWTRTKAYSLEAKAESVENLHWAYLEKEPEDPRYPPNPSSTHNNWAFWTEKTENGTTTQTVDVPASEIKRYEDAKTEVDKLQPQFMMNERKDYYVDKYNWWWDNYDGWPASRTRPP